MNRYETLIEDVVPTRLDALSAFKEDGKEIPPGDLEDIIADLPDQRKNLLEGEICETLFSCNDNELEVVKGKSEERVLRLGFGENETLKGNGDYFLEWTDKGGCRQVLLMDAAGQGRGAENIARALVDFVKNKEREGNGHIAVALDRYIDTLPLDQDMREISLVRATLAKSQEPGKKELSLAMAGQAGVFWIDGDRQGGFKLRIIPPEVVEENKFVEMVDLGEKSRFINIGFGLLPDDFGPETLLIPEDAAVFFASDGIFDAENPMTKNGFYEEMSTWVARLFQNNQGKSRKELEAELMASLKVVSKEFIQTDDETIMQVETEGEYELAKAA